MASSQPLTLLTLPSLVKNEILTNCNPTNLRTLRLVCKELKGLIEQPIHLQRLTVRMFNIGSKVTEIYQTETRWISFFVCLLDCENMPSHLPAHSEHTRLSSHFKNIRHLNIQTAPILSLWEIIPVLTETLESLTLNIIDCQLNEETTKDKSQIKLTNLKFLSIWLVQNYTLENFECLIGGSWKLETFIIPSPFPVQWNSIGDHTQDIIASLDKYLQEFRKNYSGKTRLKIDFANYVARTSYERRRIALENMRVAALVSQFQEFVQGCDVSGAELYQVPQWFLPLKSERIRVPSSFGSSIKSVWLFHFPAELFLIPIKSKIHVHVLITDGGDGQDGLDDYADNEVQIDTFTVRCNNRAQPISENLSNKLFGVFRPSVTKFTISTYKQMFSFDNIIAIGSGHQIAANYPNLLELEICRWGVDEDFQNLLRGLPNLQTLRVNGSDKKNYLTDECLIGPDPTNPLLLQLKNLTNLSINWTDVTDISFKNIFRYMRLQTFDFRYESSANVTFQHGLSTLASIDGGFKDTIETFKVCKPKDCSTRFKTLVKGFPCIRVFDIDTHSF